MQTQGYLQRKLRIEMTGNVFLLRTSNYACNASCKLFDLLWQILTSNREFYVTIAK
jgi:hypothetical protein